MTVLAIQRPNQVFSVEKSYHGLRIVTLSPKIDSVSQFLSSIGFKKEYLKEFPQKIAVVFSEDYKIWRFDKTTLQWEKYPYCTAEWYDEYDSVTSIWFGGHKPKPEATHTRAWYQDNVGTTTGWRYIPNSRINECVNDEDGQWEFNA